MESPQSLAGSGNVALAKATLSGFAEDEGLDSRVWQQRPV